MFLRRFTVLLAIVAILAIMLLLNLTLARQFEASADLNGDVARSFGARAQLQAVLSRHQDMETGQRGFVITGDPQFLEPYHDARRDLNAELQRLRTFEPDAPALRNALPDLIALSDRLITLITESVQMRRDGRQDEAIRLIAAGEGKATMDAIRAIVERVDADEARALASEMAAAVDARKWTRRWAFGLQGALILLLIGAGWVIVRSMATTQRAVQRYRDLNARQDMIFNSAKDGMMILDEAGLIQGLNPAAARIFGFETNEMEGSSVAKLFEAPPQTGEVRAFLAKLHTRPHQDFGSVQEFSGRRRDGSTFAADVALSPVSLADGHCYLATIRDITDRKHLEEMKTEFVSTVSHELRTPLTSIAGSLGLLRGGAAGPLPERAARLIRIAHDNSERLIRLINDILDIEKMESGKIAFDLHPVSLEPLLQRSIEAMHSFAAGFNVRLRLNMVPDGAEVIADEDRLVQVMTNLLSNAAKFSPPGDVVDISVTMSIPGICRITVADHGPGVPHSFQDRIFGKFAQADSSDSRQKGGTGLGLSIAREIVTRLGGSISFQSVPDRGTCFYVDLPTTPSLVFAAPPEAREGLLLEEPRILHVDDDPDTLRLVASAFEGRAEVLATPSVQEARAALMRDRFDAVVLDIGMTDGSGLDLLPLLQSAERKTPTIIFTAQDSSPALAARADAVLTKSKASLERLVEVTMAAIGREGEKEGDA